MSQVFAITANPANFAQRLRHRVDLQQRVVTRDAETSEAIAEDWESVLGSSEALIPAWVEPITGREFQAAQAPQSGVLTRVTIRHRAGVTASMRVVHEGDLYNIRAVIPDASLRRYLTLICETGVSEG